MRPLLLILIFLITGCQSRPYDHVQVGPSYPAGACREIGQVIGNAATRENAREQAINDMRYNAAKLDGDYVRLVAVSAHGSAARGVAYRCR